MNHYGDTYNTANSYRVYTFGGADLSLVDSKAPAKKRKKTVSEFGRATSANARLCVFDSASNQQLKCQGREEEFFTIFTTFTIVPRNLPLFHSSFCLKRDQFVASRPSSQIFCRRLSRLQYQARRSISISNDDTTMMLRLLCSERKTPMYTLVRARLIFIGFFTIQLSGATVLEAQTVKVP